MSTQIKDRLEYLRSQLDQECISYGELAELADLKEHIDPSDVQLLEAAGVPEFEEEKETTIKKTYHIFTNNTDEHTNDLKEAEEIFNQYIVDYGCARLYEETRDEDDELLEENCIKTHGQYPQ